MAGIGGRLHTNSDLATSLCFDFFVGNFKAFACPSLFLLHTSGIVARVSRNTSEQHQQPKQKTRNLENPRV